MPNMMNVIRRFENTLQFQVVKKTIIDGDLAEASKVPVVLWFEGTLQPIHPRELMVKPEGERKFKWWTLLSDLQLNVDWIIKDQQGAIYRVMNTTDWRDAAFYTYQLIEGPGL